MHPGAGNYDKTVVNALIKYCNKNLSDVGETYRPGICLLYTSPSPRDKRQSRMPSSA